MAKSYFGNETVCEVFLTRFQLLCDHFESSNQENNKAFVYCCKGDFYVTLNI